MDDKTVPTQNTEQSAAPSQAPEQPAMTAVRKRQQIKDTNKRIFVWLAVSSVIVSICLVAMQFLVREFMFNNKIITKKADTLDTLVTNISEADKLKENVNKLLADENLSALKYETSTTDTTALNVIIDALPVEPDATAFATSLQAAVLPRSGVLIRELNTSAEMLAGSPADPTAGAAVASEALPLPFSASFSGDYKKVEQALIDISRVIRPINLNEMKIRATDDNQIQVTIGGVTYYQPSKIVELTMEEIKP
jgi:cell division protein FtsL